MPPEKTSLLSRLKKTVSAPEKKKSPMSLHDINDPRSAIILGNGIIFAGFGAFILWAATAPLDEGVPSTGVVVVESLRKTVATLNGGTVSSIQVHENQQIKAGDVLLTLDDKKPQIAYDMIAQDYVSAWAKMIRLLAEQSGEVSVAFPDELVRYANQVGSADMLTSQEQLFRSRYRAFESEQSILRENISASAGLASSYRQQLAARQQQLALLQQELESMGPLVEKGFSSKNQLLELQRQVAESRSANSEIQSRLAKEISNGSELRMRLIQSRQTFIRDVETQLAETRREVANLSERIKDAHGDLEKTVIRAQVSGQVVSLQAQAPGTVLTPGSKILEIVPDNEKLLLDVQVPVHLINKVKPGLHTDVRVNAFPELPQLVVEGKVLSISSDRHEPKGAEPPYYLARVELTPKGIEELQGRQLRPGMAVDIVIKTGERSLLTYLLAPLSKRVFTALQEP